VKSSFCFPAERTLLRVAGRGLPGGNSLFFASPKKSKQKKGDPTCCVPSLRYGQPAVLGPAGVSCKLASLRQARALIRLALCSSAHPEGGGDRNTKQPNANTGYLNKQGLAVASPCLSWSSLDFCLRFPIPLPIAPSWLGRGAQRQADQGWHLFEPKASLCQTPLDSSTAGCPKRSAGTQTAGRLFFGDFLLAKQKKVTCRRAIPGQQPSAKSAATKTRTSYDRPGSNRGATR